MSNLCHIWRENCRGRDFKGKFWCLATKKGHCMEKMWLNDDSWIISKHLVTIQCQLSSLSTFIIMGSKAKPVSDQWLQTTSSSATVQFYEPNRKCIGLWWEKVHKEAQFSQTNLFSTKSLSLFTPPHLDLSLTPSISSFIVSNKKSSQRIRLLWIILLGVLNICFPKSNS